GLPSVHRARLVHRRGADCSRASSDILPGACPAQVVGDAASFAQGRSRCSRYGFFDREFNRTIPVTYACLREKVGLREESASLGSLVGSNFNNDGTALYEAMAALFIAQMTGVQLPLGQQAMIVLTSIVASVGAAGIPEAGLVTMTL